MVRRRTTYADLAALPEHMAGAMAADSPQPLAGTLTDARVGSESACGIQIRGALYCWGSNEGRLGDGEVGDGSTMERPDAVDVSGGTTWKLVGSGRATSCRIKTTDDTRWGAGDDADGELGDGGREPLGTPVQPGGAGITWTGGGLGPRHVCAIQTDRSLWSWGENDWGQPGDGTGSRALPVAVQDPMP